MSGSAEDDANHAARAILGGRPLGISTDILFAALAADPRLSKRHVRDARYGFDALDLGSAVEALEAATPGKTRFMALLKLARTVRPHLASREPGWFSNLMKLGRHKGESAFQLSYSRRKRSGPSTPKAVIDRDNFTRQRLNQMLVAGAVLSRIEAAKVTCVHLTIEAALTDAIDAGDIETGDEAARKNWKSFRAYCRKMTQGANTYRLLKYFGSIEKYAGRWVALPDNGTGLSPLPSNIGRPRKTG